MPEVRDEVGAENLKEAPRVDGGGDSTEPKSDTSDRDDDLSVLVRTEDDRGGVEVCSNIISLPQGGEISVGHTVSTAGVTLLARRVPNQVHPPTEELE